MVAASHSLGMSRSTLTVDDIGMESLGPSAQLSNTCIATGVVIYGYKSTTRAPMLQTENEQLDKSGTSSRYIPWNQPEDPNQPLKSYEKNAVSTAKYDTYFLTFIPLFLFEMFSRVAYLYFLIQVRLLLPFVNSMTWGCKVLQDSCMLCAAALVLDSDCHIGRRNCNGHAQMPFLWTSGFVLQASLSWWETVSPFAGYGSTAALAFVLLAAAVKAIVEDRKRQAEDHKLNTSITYVVEKEGGQWVEKETRWMHVKVGDIVKVRDGDLFPADLMCVHCDLPERICYVKTTNLDGETNLKVKRCWQRPHSAGSLTLQGPGCIALRVALRVQAVLHFDHTCNWADRAYLVIL